MKQSIISLSFSCLMVASFASGAFAAESVSAEVAYAKDKTQCSFPGKVISTKAFKGHTGSVLILATLDDRKLNKGKPFQTTVGNAKIADFPKGSFVCAQDYVGNE